MGEVLEQIEQSAKAAEEALQSAGTAAELEAFRIRYLGSKGAIKELMSLLGKVPREQKPVVGQRLNALRDKLTAAFEARKAALEATATVSGIDVTEPGRRPLLGRRHILMQVIDELVELFGRMGFSTASGPEVEDEFHNFIALNIPPSHPARDPLDNYYLLPAGDGPSGILPPTESTEIFTGSSPEGEPQAPDEAKYLLRTQTSTVQIRVMERQKPPIRVVIPGRVYRPDTHDDTHLSMFHQLEALVVDRGVSMVDLKSTILQFVHAYFGPETQVRFRPSFFPFTEPSAECDVWFEDKQRWIELGGCGMVHPNVLRAVKLDPETYTGWAFGFGIERIAMRKYGINNIRLFVENDIRFLRQF
ncbi:MAG: phenylalanine--tRNA ligase subunit alpha [Phycisphaerae bacterium]|nr:phenylalanine--tRNA ligase subunit alpha [Phycisphaerae bacterium]MDW8262303.1 phenylalanine--tRNA ligase subunit alpha [Phycisphaerales bacterium]